MKQGVIRELAAVAGVTAAALVFARRSRSGAVLAAASLALSCASARTERFRGKVVAITGGSRGLGLALGIRLLRSGARVALLARDKEELQLARAKAGASEEDCLTIPCDITDTASLQHAIAKAGERFGRLDVLINNAGLMSVGPFSTMDRDDFQSMLDIHLHAVIEGTKAVLPYFRRQGRGHLVNICSIGGKVALPHMAPYCASKFALSGLSKVIAAELAPDNVGVTTVYPGVMRAGSTIQAGFKGDHEREYAWFAALADAPVVSIELDEAARRIIDAVRRGYAEVSFPFPAVLAARAEAGFPETVAWIRGLLAHLMPLGNSRKLRSGHESRRWLDRQAWYRPVRDRAVRAQEEWNQTHHNADG